MGAGTHPTLVSSQRLRIGRLARAAALVLAAALAGPATAIAEPLRIALNSNWPPLSFDGDRGAEPDGLLTSLARSIVAERAGIAVAFAGLPWARAQAEVEAGRMDAIITVPSPARAAYALSTREALFTVTVQAATRAAGPGRARVLAQPRPFDPALSVCMDRGNDAVARMLEQDGVVPIVVHDVPLCMRLIAAGRADLVVNADPVLRAARATLGADAAAIEILPHVYSSLPLTLQVRRSRPDAAEIVARVDAAIAAARQDGSFEWLVALAYARVLR